MLNLVDDLIDEFRSHMESEYCFAPFEFPINVCAPPAESSKPVDVERTAPVEARPSKRINDRLSQDQARAELIDLRENTIKVQFPDADPARGLLRKSMLDELLRKRPQDRGEFLTKIHLDLRQNTDAE